MDIVKNHGLLDHPEHVQRILNYAPPHPKELLEQAWANATLSSEEKWEQFQATVNKFRVLMIHLLISVCSPFLLCTLFRLIKN